ncbi:MAG: hypothetical protein KIH64_002165, partial [Mycobacterium sp.]|nr:hypothetical protein [Mycobacterium sp.]
MKWIGPAAVVGGLGTALLCGAGLASADTGADSGPGQRVSQASASAPGPEKPARTARNGTASPRPAAAQVRGSQSQPTLASRAALPAPRSRVSAGT